MEQQNYQYQNNSVFVQEERSVSKKFFANVFLWMFIALIISAFAAYILTTNQALMSYLAVGRKLTILGFIALFAPIGLVFLIGRGMSRFSFSTLVGFFILYSILTGVMLSFILMVYTTTSVFMCFAAATSIFAIMAIMGYTTSVDLSQFRSILMAGVIGMVIISIVNIFMGSSTLNYILGFAGIAIFTALTAYQVQDIKRIGEGLDEAGNEVAVEDSKKLALMAALSLYITFINLLMSLLRIFGNRR